MTSFLWHLIRLLVSSLMQNFGQFSQLFQKRLEKKRGISKKLCFSPSNPWRWWEREISGLRPLQKKKFPFHKVFSASFSRKLVPSFQEKEEKTPLIASVDPNGRSARWRRGIYLPNQYWRGGAHLRVTTLPVVQLMIREGRNQSLVGDKNPQVFSPLFLTPDSTRQVHDIAILVGQ